MSADQWSNGGSYLERGNAESGSHGSGKVSLSDTELHVLWLGDVLSEELFEIVVDNACRDKRRKGIRASAEREVEAVKRQ